MFVLVFSHPPMCGILFRDCQEVRYDCIIRYRSQPQPAPLLCIDSSCWCRRPEIGPCSAFHLCTVFICPENIHALFSHVSSTSAWSFDCSFMVWAIRVSSNHLFSFVLSVLFAEHEGRLNRDFVIIKSDIDQYKWFNLTWEQGAAIIYAGFVIFSWSMVTMTNH